MQNKKNDWLATIVNQPDFTISDMYENGITPNNTAIKEKDYYKNIPQIIEKFSENGEFNEEKFDNFYQSALLTYNEYADKEFENTILENYENDPYVWWKNNDSTPELEISKNSDHTGRQYGISNINESGDPIWSIRERGQRNKYWDNSKNEWSEFTPNDVGGLFKSFKRDDMALAIWKEDGSHNVDGRSIKHKAGDLKLNEDGDYFYETIVDGEETYNRDMLNIVDTITTDGTAWNKYDMFDSDGLDKSATGTAMKALATIAPLFIPKVGIVYGALSAASALSQVLPTIGKSINGIISGTNENELGETLTNIENYTSRFKDSTSDYSRENMISFENLGKLVTDISMQLYQQKAIGAIPKLLNSNGNITINTKLGQSLSLAYMSATSSAQVYSEFKNAGADDRVAGAGMVASMLAMYKLMSNDHFKGVLFKGTSLDDSFIKSAGKDGVKLVKESIGINDTPTTKKGFAKLISTISDKLEQSYLKSAKSKYGSLPVVSATEAVEETMEEFSFDAIKGLFKGLDAIGIPMNEEDSGINFKFNLKDAFARYAMSFAGGALGGPIFQMHNRYNDYINGNIVNDSNREYIEELVYLARSGRVNELRDYYMNLHKKGKLGNKNLSAIDSEIINTPKGEETIYHGDNGKLNQNDAVLNILLSHVDYVDNLVSNEGLKIPESELKKMLLSLKDNKQYDPITNAIINSGVHGSMLNDLQTLTTDIVKTKSELDSEIGKRISSSATSDEINNLEELLKDDYTLKALNDKLISLREKKDAMLNGEMSSYYLGQSLFILDETTHEYLVNTTKNNFSKVKTGKSYDLLSDYDKVKIDDEYSEYINSDGKVNMFRAYDIYTKLSEDFKDVISSTKDISENNKYILNFQKAVQLENEIANKRIELANEIDENKANKLEIEINNLETLKINYSDSKNILNVSGDFDSVLTAQEINDDYITNYANKIIEYYTNARDNQISGVNSNELESFLNNASNYIIGKMEMNGIFDYGMVDSQILTKAITEGDVVALTEIKNNIDNFYSSNRIDATDYFKLGDVSLIDLITNITSAISEIKPSEYSKLLEQFSTSINSKATPLIKLLNDEENNLRGLPNIENYIIENKNIEEELKDLTELVNILNSIIHGAYSGLNENLNSFGFNFAELSKNQSDALLNQSERISNKAQILHQISEHNKNKKLKVQKDITINMKPKFIKSLVKNSEIINDIFGINIKEIWDSKIGDFDINTLTESNYSEFEKIAIDFESEIYNQFKDIRLTKDDLRKLIESHKDIYSMRSTKLNTDPNSLVSEFDSIVYLLSTISINSSDFHYELKSIINNLNLQYATIFPQELAIKTAYSNIVNSELFNTFLEILKENKTEDDYLNNKKSLLNTTVILGGAGTGKTTAIARILTELLKGHKATFAALAPSKAQVDKLEKSLELKDIVKYTSISGIDDFNNTSDFVIENGHIIYNGEVKNTPLINGNGLKVLFVDECTLFSEPELTMLVNNAVENNIKIVMLGDFKQNSAKVLIKESDKQFVQDSGLEDTMFIKAPLLTTTLRANTIGKSDNAIVMSSILDLTLDRYVDSPTFTTNDLGEITKNLLSTKPILKYYDESNSLYGEKITTEITDDDVYKISKLSNSLLIITDNIEKYNKFADIATIRNANDSQGGEFDYVIIDKKWSDNSFSALRDLYTLSQRSRFGSLIKDNDIKHILNIDNINDANASTLIQLNESEIDIFKKWRLEGIDHLENGNEIQIRDSILENQPDNSNSDNSDSNQQNNQQNDNQSSQSDNYNIDELFFDGEYNDPYSNNSSANSTSGYDESKQSVNDVNNEIENEQVGVVQTDPQLSVDGTIVKTTNTATPVTRKFRGDVITSNLRFNKWLYEVIKDSNDQPNSEFYNKFIKPIADLYNGNKEKSQEFIRNVADNIKFNNVNYSENDYVNEGLFIEEISKNDPKILYAKLSKNGKYINIPILFVDVDKEGKYNGKIELSEGSSYKSNSESATWMTLESLFSDNIFMGNNTIIPSYSENDIKGVADKGKQTFLKQNNGKTFFVLSDDYTRFNDKLASYNNDTLLEDFRDGKLVGIQKIGTLKSILDTSLELHKKLISKNEENPSVTEKKEGLPTLDNTIKLINFILKKNYSDVKEKFSLLRSISAGKKLSETKAINNVVTVKRNDKSYFLSDTRTTYTDVKNGWFTFENDKLIEVKDFELNLDDDVQLSNIVGKSVYDSDTFQQIVILLKNLYNTDDNFMITSVKSDVNIDTIWEGIKKNYKHGIFINDISGGYDPDTKIKIDKLNPNEYMVHIDTNSLKGSSFLINSNQIETIKSNVNSESVITTPTVTSESILSSTNEPVATNQLNPTIITSEPVVTTNEPIITTRVNTPLTELDLKHIKYIGIRTELKEYINRGNYGIELLYEVDKNDVNDYEALIGELILDVNTKMYNSDNKHYLKFRTDNKMLIQESIDGTNRLFVRKFNELTNKNITESNVERIYDGSNFNVFSLSLQNNNTETYVYKYDSGSNHIYITETFNEVNNIINKLDDTNDAKLIKALESILSNSTKGDPFKDIDFWSLNKDIRTDILNYLNNRLNHGEC